MFLTLIYYSSVKGGVFLQEKRYHHGNLKVALIEAGINIINEFGELGLSLRKVAAKCNVSQSAPYAHFKNKEDMIHAMQEHVTEQFMKVLERAIVDEREGSKELILKMGEAYISFFIDNPHYFRFLFFTPYLHINLSLNEEEDIYPPYKLFKRHAVRLLEEMNCPREAMLSRITNLWGTVQGIALIATQENVTYDGDFKKDIYKIISNE